MRIGLVGVGRIGAYHAATLSRLAKVDWAVVADADAGRAREVAGRLGLTAVSSPEQLFGSGIDALVVATTTATHPEFISRAAQAGLPVFCEKPVAADITGTLEVIDAVGSASVPVQIGFQRRFDAGFAAVRSAIRAGALGWVHTIRSTTFDAYPPPPAYIARSGGLFRDCAVHDFDAIRWATGREAVTVYAAGENRGEDFFREAGDVDTASALLTLDDGTLAMVSCTRYNAAGYDVRLEVLGSRDDICAGLTDRTPVRSADPGVSSPAGPAYADFLDRFGEAYQAELAAFIDLAASGGDSPCTMFDALEAFYIAEACELSRARRAPVDVAEVRR